MGARAGTPRRRLGLLGAMLAAWLLAVSAEAAPHLVHHLFEADDQPESDCSFLTAVDRTPGDVVLPVVAVAPPAASEPAVTLAEIRRPSRPAATPSSRSPPR